MKPPLPIFQQASAWLLDQRIHAKYATKPEPHTRSAGPLDNQREGPYNYCPGRAGPWASANFPVSVSLWQTHLQEVIGKEGPQAMLRLLLDNTIINLLSGQAKLSRHERDRLRVGLRRKVAQEEWRVVGSVPLIEEMCGIGDRTKYEVASSLYWDLIRGRILKPWQYRIRAEMEKGSALTGEEMELDKQLIQRIRGRATDPARMRHLLEGVQRGKRMYQAVIREMTANIKLDERWRQLGPYGNITQWFHDWKDPLFDLLLRHSRGESGFATGGPLAGTPRPDLEELPATRAWVWFMVTKLYEHLVLGLRVDKGDKYDMSYYIDALPGGHLATEDPWLIQTCQRMPDSRVSVLRLELLAEMLGEQRIAQKVRVPAAVP